MLKPMESVCVSDLNLYHCLKHSVEDNLVVFFSNMITLECVGAFILEAYNIAFTWLVSSKLTISV
ncbi:hypothetical protein [Photobacterium satsumensis]|uniref:hypothetical protein n=1 Tax=Photobacterium satsumensis TaxID=2910239 RepID=UPI003D0C3C25